MYNYPIGVMLESFRLPVKDAVRAAVDVGAQGVQVLAARGELSPFELTGSKRTEFLDIIRSNGLVISALCGDLGRGFGDKELNPELIESSKRIIDLAKELGTDIVTTHIGVVPADKSHVRYKVMQEACYELASYADSIDAHFAVETGPEIATVLKDFLDSLGSRGVTVNMDPANFVMVTGDDPVQAVYTLRDYIVHTHAKDGRKLLDKDSELIYRIIEEEIKTGKAFEELPLGEGDVDFDNYLKALDDIGYKGFLTIEREVGSNPYEDIAAAVKFLTTFFV